MAWPPGWVAPRGLSHREQVRTAFSFTLAAVRLRLQDASDLAWRPVDALLRARAKSNLFVWLPVLAVALVVVHHEGFYGLVTNVDNLAETCGGFYGVIRVGRWYRKVKPPEPKPHRAKE